jgi:diaminopimelate epimerase
MLVSRPETLELAKHHASGNDFLVLVDLEDRRPLSPSEVGALCDRHRGVGADGLIRVVRGDPGVSGLRMDLKNADGSPAEMSGNGIRCLVQAAVDEGAAEPGELEVATPCGVRTVTYEERGPGLGYAAVEMGEAFVGSEISVDVPVGVTRAVEVSMGNPHLVLLCASVDDHVVAAHGSRLSHSVPGGTNVEFVTAPQASRLLHTVEVRVYERGVGETLACGTGACAVVAALTEWKLAAPRVEVTMPGGILLVSSGAEGMVLSGPTRRVARISVSESDLSALAAEWSGSRTDLRPTELAGRA